MSLFDTLISAESEELFGRTRPELGGTLNGGINPSAGSLPRQQNLIHHTKSGGTVTMIDRSDSSAPRLDRPVSAPQDGQGPSPGECSCIG